MGDVAIAMSAIRAKDVMTFFVAECATGRPLFVAGSTDKALGLSPDQLIGDPRGALRLLGAENGAEYDALRKLVRVARVDDVPLAPGPATRCCALHLPYTKEGGGYVVYGRGIEHSLASLPDFKLACQVGAGNFPAERLALHVPAADIARLLNN